MIGTTVSHYRITGKLGSGGMGEVYRAEDITLGREVAVKVLPQAFTQDPERLARFEREAKVLASLNHPNVGGIYDLEESDGVKALVLELVEGEHHEVVGSAKTSLFVADAFMFTDFEQALEWRQVIDPDGKHATVMVSAPDCHPVPLPVLSLATPEDAVHGS